jgi:DNA topoisomerase IA
MEFTMSHSKDLRKIADDYAPQAVFPFTYDEIITISRAKLGLRREQVTSALQTLFANKQISDPHTELPYIPTSLMPNLPLIMAALDIKFSTDRPERYQDGHYLSPAWRSTESFEDRNHGIIPTNQFDTALYDAMPEEHQKVFNLIVERFVAVFSLKPSRISKDAREKLLAAADLIEQLEQDVSDENKGLWRFWNRKATELAAKLSEKTPS